jgi:hypothetical protein
MRGSKPWASTLASHPHHGHENYQNNINSKGHEPTMTNVKLILSSNMKHKNLISKNMKSAT